MGLTATVIADAYDVIRDQLPAAVVDARIGGEVVRVIRPTGDTGATSGLWGSTDGAEGVVFAKSSELPAAKIVTGDRFDLRGDDGDFVAWRAVSVRLVGDTVYEITYGREAQGVA